MSLIDKEGRPCTTMVRTCVDDGEGGQITEYLEGREFLAVVTPIDSEGKKIIGNTEMSAKKYKFFYPSIITLSLNDVVKTLDDDKTYRVTALETVPAKSASVQYSLVSAEEWEMPNE